MLIKEKDRQVLSELFHNELTGPVHLVVFGDGNTDPDYASDACPLCPQTVQLATEVGELSDHITVDVYNFHTDAKQVEQYGITKAPAIAIVGKKDYGVRYYGIPGGYEFTSFIEDIVDVARGESGLSVETRQRLQQIDAPVHIQVFVTPTCPYCPQAVRLAHKLAIANEHIVADMVEAQEFPELAGHYNVYGVPRTVVNEHYHFEGAVPEDTFVSHVLHAAGKLTEQEAVAAGLNGR